MIKIKNNAGKVIEVTKFAYDVIYKHREGFTIITDGKHDEPIQEPQEEPQIEQETNSNNQVDYSKLDWHELRKLASDKGVNVKGLKRDEIENLLKAGDE